MLEHGRGFARGQCSREPSPFGTWACYDDEHGRRQYEWGHYGSDREALTRDLSERVEDYQRQFAVKGAWVEEPGLYKYYFTQRPVDIGTFPKPPHNAPDEIINYDQRVPVEGGAFLAWGHLTYTRPLSEQDMTNYELRPSKDNPAVGRRMERKRAAEQEEKKPSISQQMKEAGRQAQERQTPATPKKDAPDRGER